MSHYGFLITNYLPSNHLTYKYHGPSSKGMKLSINLDAIHDNDDQQPVDKEIHHPIEILPYLYLGSAKLAAHQDVVTEFNIVAIMNVAKEAMTPTDIVFQQAPNSAPATKTEAIEKYQFPTFTKFTHENEDKKHRRTSTMDANSKPIEYARFKWSHYQEDFSMYLNMCISFIEKHRSKRENVMIHCQCGVSRSVSVIIAYLMYHHKIRFQEALQMVKEKSPTANPHLSFVCQLLEIEELMLDEA